VHSVRVSDFYIARHEVTQKLYESVMGNNPFENKELGGGSPINNVSWYDAVEFCNKLSDKEGLNSCYSGSGDNIKCDFKANGYRLPTEAEWEYAARGGAESQGYEYSGSEDKNLLLQYYCESTPNGCLIANELEIYNMNSSLWEWCWDLYGDYNSSKQANPRGSGSGSQRVLRGGNFDGTCLEFCRNASRFKNPPSTFYSSLGMRLSRASPY
jgi:formylglycine-generating enzyme required for sulfatase activity